MSSIQKYMIRSIIRWLLTAVLLYFVWAGPRWVTAFAITLLIIANEITTFALAAIFHWRKKFFP